MKGLLLAAAVAALASAGARAQGSITLYGRVNVSTESQRAQGVTSAELVNNASRIGLLGSEDLGRGLRAGFEIEHGFSVDTGEAASRFWGRQSELNLQSGVGLLRLGNFRSEAYYATADFVSLHNHNSGTSGDALYAYVGRNVNKVAYRLPVFARSMTLEGAVALAEDPALSRTFDLAWNYTAGTLALGAGYGRNGSARQAALRAMVTLGRVVVGGYVQHDENGWRADAGRRTSARAALMVRVGDGEWHANYGASGAYSRIAGSRADQFTLAYNHNLSKRTKVYAFYTQTNDATATYGRGGDFSSLALGTRHNF